MDLDDDTPLECWIIVPIDRFISDRDEFLDETGYCGQFCTRGREKERKRERRFMEFLEMHPFPDMIHA